MLVRKHLMQREQLQNAQLTIQTCVRAALAALSFSRLRQSVIVMQKTARGFAIRQRLSFVQNTCLEITESVNAANESAKVTLWSTLKHSAITIQKYARLMLARKLLMRLQTSSIRNEVKGKAVHQS